MCCKFTKLDGDRIVNFEVSSAYMDDLERKNDLKAQDRDAQFERLRQRIEDAASAEYYSRGGDVQDDTLKY